MAGRKENLKALFTNTRSRVIIIFTLVLLVLAVLYGLTRFMRSTDDASLGRSDVTNAPGIQSIPGALDPTIQYAKLQEAQNVSQAQAALKTGGSAIPTIVRSQELGAGVQGIGSQGGKGGLSFTGLNIAEQAGTQRDLWLQDLQNNNCSKATVTKVVAQGASLAVLRNACSCIQLKDVGYQINALQQVCSCQELKAAGFNASQFRSIGYTAERLRTCQFNACELRAVGFTAQELKDGGFTDGELKGAGFNDQEIARASGLPHNISIGDVRSADCQPAALARLRAAGVSAGAIRRINGCSAAQLKAAGFTAQQLRNAGFTAADLKNAGFTPAQLRQAGYSARDLLNAGFTPADLSQAGFSPAEIAAAQSQLPPGITADEIRQADCNVAALRNERLAGVSARLIRQYAGCNPQTLRAAGFTDDDLENAGFTPAQINAGTTPVSDDTIRAAGCDPAKLRILRNQGVTAKEIHDLNGCDVQTLRAAGFSRGDLENAGFTPAQINAGLTPISNDVIRAADCDPTKLRTLLNQGVSAKEIHDLNGCSAQTLRAAGFSPADLLEAGFSPQDLAAAGFTPDQIRAALADPTVAIRAADCDPAKLANLLRQGVSAAQIRELNGCSAQTLRAAGYNASALAGAGFSPQDLAAAGFTPAQISQVSTTPAALIAAGRTADCNVAALSAARAAGVSAATIRETLGCGAAALKAAGFSAADLRNAGFTAAELRNAGFTADQLKAAGYTARELRDAGFSARDLANAGFTPAQLREAGFTAAQMKAAGFNAGQLRAAGYSAKDLKDAGFSAADLKAAGFSAQQLKEAGFSAQDLKNAGFSASDLKAAGFTAQDLANAGFTAAELQNAGFSPNDIAGAQAAGAQIPGLNAPPTGLGSASAIPAIGVTGPGVTTVNPYASNIPAANLAAARNAQMQAVLDRQNQQMADQRYQQRIQDRQSQMLGAANQYLQNWSRVTTQVYSAGNPETKATTKVTTVTRGPTNSPATLINSNSNAPPQKALIKTGDILFAVIDTSINSDEPGPILATVVSGRFKGAKLIGSFNLPNNADKMVISFNTMSVPGANKSTSINAYAIDMNTARTALSSRTDHHYLLRYGSLFASSFLEGFGNAFQSANTQVTIGGTGGGDNVTIQNGIGRSALENAVIGLATVGKNWGQVAQQQFSTPTTVYVYSGTGIGVLFTQDLMTL
ncbi:IcmE/DotG protein [Legionella beliardensis]|uniref:IcmE/DotG protein n=1 Tax=Legionella beliardensis TaxID=91822 RepID=A0A378I077_9GAMM|nr:type IVB secretion system protein DotG/IcmE [Legionella beliardensis]STX28151.1 IcmE/DotG protein [Legionella beliardensis]